MNCNEAGQVMLAYGEERLPAVERERMERHVEDCPTCRREARRVRRNSEYLGKRLTSLPGLLPPDLFAVEEAAQRSRLRASGRSSALVRVAGIALLLLLIGGAVWLLSRDRAPVTPLDTATGTTSSPAPDRPVAPIAPADPPAEPPTAFHETLWPLVYPITGGSVPEYKLSEFLQAPCLARLDRLWMRVARGLISFRDLLVEIEGASSTETALLTLALLPVRDEPAVRSEIRRLLDDSDRQVRVSAAAVLAGTRDYRMTMERVPLVSGLLVRVGPIFDPERRSVLSDALTEEKDPYVLTRLVWMLGPSASIDPSVADGLRQLTRSSDPLVRAVAATALERRRAPIPVRSGSGKR